MRLKEIIARMQARGWRYGQTILDAKYGLGRLEELMASNWLNPFATFWLNVRSFPVKQALQFPVFVYGRPKLRCLSGSMEVKGKVRPGMVSVNKVRMMAPGLMTCKTELVNQGRIIFYGKGEIGTGNKIVTYFGAELHLGNGFKIQDEVNLGCMKYISIGEQSWIVHRCQVFDTNYHYVANLNKMTIPTCIKPIHIGNYCWVGNTSTVSGGAALPDYTIVCSNSLVNSHTNAIPENSIIGGIPAKLISTGYRRVFNNELDTSCRLHYRDEPDRMFVIPDSYSSDDIVKA